MQTSLLECTYNFEFSVKISNKVTPFVHVGFVHDVTDV